jgi:hypothetical protein
MVKVPETALQSSFENAFKLQFDLLLGTQLYDKIAPKARLDSFLYGPTVPPHYCCSFRCASTISTAMAVHQTSPQFTITVETAFQFSQK